MHEIIEALRPWLGAGLAVMLLSLALNSYFIWKIDRLEGWLIELGKKHNDFTRDTAKVIDVLHRNNKELQRAHNAFVADVIKELDLPAPKEGLFDVIYSKPVEEKK